MYVNSTTVVCTAPDAAEGVVAVSSNGVDYSASNATYEYVDAHHVHDVLRCKWGYIIERVWHRFQKYQRFVLSFWIVATCSWFVFNINSWHVYPRCTWPVSIEVTTNGVDYSEDMVQYRYYASPAVSHIVPSSGPTEGGTVISVMAVILLILTL